jgi:hypothetical protein
MNMSVDLIPSSTHIDAKSFADLTEDRLMVVEGPSGGRGK